MYSVASRRRSSEWLFNLCIRPALELFAVFENNCSTCYTRKLRTVILLMRTSFVIHRSHLATFNPNITSSAKCNPSFMIHTFADYASFNFEIILVMLVLAWPDMSTIPLIKCCCRTCETTDWPELLMIANHTGTPISNKFRVFISNFYNYYLLLLHNELDLHLIITIIP